MNLEDPQTRLNWIFFGNETDLLRQQFFQSQTLAHYTTAENALNMLKGEVWLRNTRVMNDFAEIEYGVDMIKKAIQPGGVTELESALQHVAKMIDEVHPGLYNEALNSFSDMLPSLINHTYVTCLSVHHPKKEQHGRLSMWRAYTGNYAGVALILNPEPFTQMLEDPSFFSVPVSYDNEEELEEKMVATAKQVAANREFIAETPRWLIGWYLVNLLRRIATASKHHGFREEEEWRVMHTRFVDPSDGLQYATATIRGIPQIVSKLKLTGDGPFASRGMTIANLVREVIIGPTNYPLIVAEAIEAAMTEAGIADAWSKITVSKIPLRMATL